MLPAKKEDHVRCIGCGKPIQENEAVFRILVGNLGDGFDREYGDIHRKCFERSVESPQSVMDEIRRISKQGKSLRA